MGWKQDQCDSGDFAPKCDVRTISKGDFMQTNHYINLLSQANKLYRHNRQGSYKTKERYYEAFKRFLRYLADVYRLEKIANISGKHLSSYVEYMQYRNYSASTIKTDLAKWTGPGAMVNLTK